MTDSNRRAVRTAFQALLAVAAAVPLLADSPGMADLPGYATLVAAATALSRLMSMPAVERLLPPWLKAEAEEGADGE
ncbi:hypothetical protein Sipo8835_46225 [Streptomyces ipomoeae]|uniref:Holin n=2 Tax=Streptomyces ipomoeae TaxID=103232 RepID=L1L3D6_9ACTN|nr:hypothetical protein [Streptomyces ipomoeae]EKX67133.1 hypothetical protein STRIP9103_03550 [Streptomyces ipomoeae 91-03]MDX2698091.1 hypothetical protein [Streptomyces ipomoeae]MDX2846494.1 hypothetical protein [Streptomyces ipomoeae]TQE15189.1 hypothetical protein Sipo8835_46225 [Streptomyces ipomoeae]TQE25581.1 hypothetical protein Sipo7851_34555 [Streptomyces ipomoeae]